jgi:hypothetical protein
MKTKKFLIQWTALLTLAIFGLQPIAVTAQTSSFTYQGQLTENGSAVNGNYDLSFTLFGSSNGVSIVAGPITNVAIAVSGGLFTTTLDFGGAAFASGADRWLEIASRTNGTGIFGTLAPRQQITSTPYAITASTVTGSVAAGQISGTLGNSQIAGNAITSVKISDGSVSNVDLSADAVTSAKILDGTIVGADLANNTVTSAQLADSIDLGTTNVNGLLNVYRTTTNTPSITLFGNSSQISTYGSDGQEQIRLWGTSYGEILLNDSSPTNHTAVTLTANGTSGGFLDLNQGNSFSLGARVNGDSLGGGRFRGFNSSNSVSLDLRSQFDSATAAGWVGLYDNGSERITLAARNGTSGKGGLLDVKNDSSLSTLRLIGDTGSGDSSLEMYAGGTNLSFRILADDSGSGSAMFLYEGSGSQRIEIDSDDGDDAAIIRLKNSSGAITITLDAELNGKSKITTQDATVSGLLALPSTSITLAANSTLTATNSYVRVTGSGGAAVTLSATTAIANGNTSGAVLVLEGTSDTATVTIPTGANTVFPASRTLGLNDTLTLIWNGSDWVQLAFSNN